MTDFFSFVEEVQNAIQAQEVGVPLTILTPDNKTIKVIKKWRTDGIEPENLDPNASQSDLANMQVSNCESKRIIDHSYLVCFAETVQNCHILQNNISSVVIDPPGRPTVTVDSDD